VLLACGMDIIIFYAGLITCKIMYRMCRFIFYMFSKDIFSAIYIYGIHKRFCPHSVSRILPMHIPAPNPNLFASKSILTSVRLPL
jgi:hypothetical protein